jgi:hypothetical protein
MDDLKETAQGVVADGGGTRAVRGLRCIRRREHEKDLIDEQVLEERKIVERKIRD